MTEQQYLDATNLAKLRTARAILSDCLFTDLDDENAERNARVIVVQLIEKLEKKINIED